MGDYSCLLNSKVTSPYSLDFLNILYQSLLDRLQKKLEPQ